jgi:hypothetical protein
MAHKLTAKEDRQAWTDFVLRGQKAQGAIDAILSKPDAPSKYHNERAGKYASRHEADVATKLNALASCGKILELREQVRIVLVEGKPGIPAVTYIADFTYFDLDGKYHVLDAKGFKTQVYRLKKRLAALLLGIEIEEV